MGEEADADWQDGLVEAGIEAGIEDCKRWLEEKMMEAMLGGKPQKRRQTALRARGRSFETVELDDAGNVIEPVRCTCGAYAVMHWTGCPFAYAVT